MAGEGGSAVENMQPAAPEPEAEAPPEGMKLDWLECDACGKWRDKMLQPADGSGYQHWQCAVGGRRCEEDCDFCHTSPCSCDKLDTSAYLVTGTRIPHPDFVPNIKWRKGFDENGIPNGDPWLVWCTKCKVCGRSATAIDRRKKMDEWIAKHGPNTRCGNQWVRQRDGQTLTADDFTYKLPKDQREIASHLKEINRLRQAMGHDAIVIPGRAEGGGAGGAAGGAGSQGGSTRVPAGAESEGNGGVGAARGPAGAGPAAGVPATRNGGNGGEGQDTSIGDPLGKRQHEAGAPVVDAGTSGRGTAEDGEGPAKRPKSALSGLSAEAVSQGGLAGRLAQPSTPEAVEMEANDTDRGAVGEAEVAGAVEAASEPEGQSRAPSGVPDAAVAAERPQWRAPEAAGSSRQRVADLSAVPALQRPAEGHPRFASIEALLRDVTPASLGQMGRTVGGGAAMGGVAGGGVSAGGAVGGAEGAAPLLEQCLDHCEAVIRDCKGDAEMLAAAMRGIVRHLGRAAARASVERASVAEELGRVSRAYGQVEAARDELAACVAALHHATAAGGDVLAQLSPLSRAAVTRHSAAMKDQRMGTSASGS